MDIHKVSYLMMCKCNYSIEDGYAIRGNATYVRSVSSSLFSKEIRERDDHLNMCDRCKYDVYGSCLKQH